MIRIFVGAGQSNMDGRGIVSESPSHSNASRIFNYAKDSVLKPAVEPVTDSTGVIYPPFNDGSSAIGPLMPFANKMADYYPDDIIVIVPCSKGSTAIKAWRRLPTTLNLYGGTQARIREAVAAAKLEWPTEEVKLCGLIFWQGDSDTLNAADANSWREDFGHWVANMRVDIGDLSLPIVFGRMNNLNNPAHPYKSTLRAAMTVTYIPNVKWANMDSPNVQYKNDNAHATTAGMQAAGVEFADRMYEIMEIL